GPQGARRDRLAQAPGQSLRGRPGRRHSNRVRSRRSGDAGAAVSFSRRAATARCRGAIQGAVHVDHEHAAAALPQTHPGAEPQPVEGALKRPSGWDQLESRILNPVKPGPAANPAPNEKVNVLQVTLPTNFKVARFDSEEHTTILRRLQDDIEAVRFDTGDG